MKLWTPRSIFLGLLGLGFLITSYGGDICYESIEYKSQGFGFCMDLGPVKGGINCRQTIHLRNTSDKILSNPEVILDLSGINGKILSKCGVNNNPGCQDDSKNMGPLGVFTRSLIYDLPDFGPDDHNSVYDEAKVQMAIFSGENLYSRYIKDGIEHYSPILPCNTSTKDVGPIDGYENDPFEDLSIDTKIEQKPFTLKIGTFDSDRSRFQKLSGKGSIKFYIKGPNKISPDYYYDIKNSTKTYTIEVNSSTPNSFVEFEICSTLTNDWTVYPSNRCSQRVACNKKSRKPEFHICRSTDSFAVRPYTIEIPDSEFYSGQMSPLSIIALDYQGQKSNYNPDLTSMVINHNIKGIGDLTLQGRIQNAEINFTDVGILDLDIKDTEYCKIDSNVITLGGTVTFVPYNFKLDLNKETDTVLLSSDLRMSTNIEGNITALNYTGQITKNFSENVFNNPLDIQLTQVHDNLVPIYNTGPKKLRPFKDGVLTVHNLRSNFERHYNKPIDPFTIPVSVKVKSEFESHTVQSQKDMNFTFIYGIARPPLEFIDDIRSDLKTSFSIQGYCSTDDCPMTQMSQRTNVPNWYILEGVHTGLPVLKSSTPFFSQNGRNIVYENPGTDLPRIEKVYFLEDSWLLYNPDFDAPRTFFRVRFIGVSDWSGYGRTGHVVGGTMNYKKSRSIEW